MHTTVFSLFFLVCLFFFLIVTEFKKYIRIDSPKSNHVKKSNPSSGRCIDPKSHNASGTSMSSCRTSHQARIQLIVTQFFHIIRDFKKITTATATRTWRNKKSYESLYTTSFWQGNSTAIWSRFYFEINITSICYATRKISHHQKRLTHRATGETLRG